MKPNRKVFYARHTARPDSGTVACRADTPAGIFTAVYQEGFIVRVLFPDEDLSAAYNTFDDTLPFAEQMAQYFAGKRKSFDLPLRISGTPFMQDVYRATLRIPYGRTAAYADVALAAGYPLAMRAAGTALKRTPLPILIPCHRVVHKTASRSAYRGGTGLKDVLLELESLHVNREDTIPTQSGNNSP